MKYPYSTNVFSRLCVGHESNVGRYSGLERESTTTSRIAICIKVLRDTPCFRKDKANTGFKDRANADLFLSTRACVKHWIHSLRDSQC